VDRLFDGAAALRSAVEAVGGDREATAFGDLTTARHRLEELEAPGEVDVQGGNESGDAGVSSGTGDRVRVPFAKLDGLLAEVGELMGEALALERRLAQRGEREPRNDAEAIRRRAAGLREAVMALRLVPIGRVLSRFHGLVRRLAAEQGKEARLIVVGEGTELDKSTADALAEPLLHLVRNAIDHGIRSPEEREAAGKPRHGTVWIRAAQEGDRVRLEVADDGTGLDLPAIRKRARASGLIGRGGGLTDAEVSRLIFRPGFSTRSDVSTVSGRGVGLDVVRRSVRELRGELDVEAEPEGGTRFVLRLPLTVAVVPSVVFQSAGELLALPAGHVVRTVRMEGLERVGAAPVLREEERVVPVVDPDRLFDWPPAERGPFGVLVSDGEDRVILSADRLLDQRDLVVKALPRFGAPKRAVSGGSVLPGGQVILMLDPAGIIDLSEERAGGDRGG
jgi:two-component system chemotaxis sensor kinase CheA